MNVLVAAAGLTDAEAYRDIVIPTLRKTVTVLAVILLYYSTGIV